MIQSGSCQTETRDQADAVGNYASARRDEPRRPVRRCVADDDAYAEELLMSTADRDEIDDGSARSTSS
jgi:hypothetical protein